MTELTSLTLAQARDRLRNKDITATELTDAHIGAVEAARALNAFIKLAQLEGIIPALESAHAVAEVMKRAPGMSPDQIVIVNLSGRGDKDVAQVAAKVKL